MESDHFFKTSLAGLDLADIGGTFADGIIDGIEESAGTTRIRLLAIVPVF